MEPPAPRPLEYDTQPPPRWHRYSRWAVIAASMIVAAGLLHKARPILLARVRQMRLEHAALAAKPTQSPLLAADGTTHVPAAWTDWADASEFIRSPIFIALRRSRAGQRIVVVDRPRIVHSPSITFEYDMLGISSAQPTELLRAPQQRMDQHIENIPPGSTIDIGTLDPVDERHFILAGHFSGGAIQVDGWLLDEGQTSLQLRYASSTQP